MDNNDIIQHKSRRNIDSSKVEVMITSLPMFIMIFIFVANLAVTLAGLVIMSKLNKDNGDNNSKNNYILQLYLGIINIIISIIHILCIYFYLDKKESLIALVLLVITNIFNIVMLIYTQNNQILVDVHFKKRLPIVTVSMVISLIFGMINHKFIYDIMSKNTSNKS